jgi:hypothetical protein
VPSTGVVGPANRFGLACSGIGGFVDLANVDVEGVDHTNHLGWRCGGAGAHQRRACSRTTPPLLAHAAPTPALP